MRLMTQSPVKMQGLGWQSGTGRAAAAGAVNTCKCGCKAAPSTCPQLPNPLASLARSLRYGPAAWPNRHSQVTARSFTREHASSFLAGASLPRPYCKLTINTLEHNRRMRVPITRYESASLVKIKAYLCVFSNHRTWSPFLGRIRSSVIGAMMCSLAKEVNFLPSSLISHNTFSYHSHIVGHFNFSSLDIYVLYNFVMRLDLEKSKRCTISNRYSFCMINHDRFF
jgi:hypothetical protein